MDDINFQDVLKFWFDKPELWFVKDPAFDKLIKEKFLDTYTAAAQGQLILWESQALSMLALIITLDQFPRNMFRGTDQAFASDSMARDLTKTSLECGFDQELSLPVQRKFMYMPLMHSENIEDQNLCVQLFEQLQNPQDIYYAHAHRDIIARFGRFPHRNVILGRNSTPEEEVFLKEPGSSF